MHDKAKPGSNKRAPARELLSIEPASAGQGRIDLLRLSRLGGVEVMDVEDVSRKWTYFHETYSFCVASRVASTEAVPWRYRLRTQSMHSEGVQLMEPGELHANLVDAPRADFRVLMLSPKRVMEVARQLGWERESPLHLRVAQLGHGAVRKSLQTLMKAIVDDGDLERSELGVYRLLETLSKHGCLETRLPTRRDPRCRGESAAWRARDLIHEHWNQHLPVDVVTTMVGIPMSTLERAFKAAYGTSPRQYQTHLRLIRAKELLKNGQTSVTAAASEVGFHDPDYFSRIFRREFGSGPNGYRMRAGSGVRVLEDDQDAG
ncbi:MAG TPA: AraC family transcriptional regulator [Polyangiaceae bacterium]|nr:AraC family transcriptional regulator [Polyangiaceae bacterium]